MTRLTHLDEKGAARMVDVGSKAVTARQASARGRVLMKPQTLALIESGTAKKGDVLAAARIAGIMAAKRTHELIPLCHPLMITSIVVEFTLERDESAVEVSATVKVDGKTGVEMEALTAVSIACLTIYDMCKSADRAMRIADVRLVEKSGGKSGRFVSDEP
jgi:cyclic pyranopterin phosphate synthase